MNRVKSLSGQNDGTKSPVPQNRKSPFLFRERISVECVCQNRVCKRNVSFAQFIYMVIVNTMHLYGKIFMNNSERIKTKLSLG